jgi:CHAT domain-containing protein
MIRDIDRSHSRRDCLTDEDLYRYISGEGIADAHTAAEMHFARCPECRRNLAELLEILHPEAGQDSEIQEPAKAELDRAVALVGDIARKEQAVGSSLFRRLRVPLAAAAMIGFVAVNLIGFKYFYEKRRSQAFFNEAKLALEKSYTGTSPGNLRLALPFSPASVNRKSTGSESFRRVENLFSKALAVREDMAEAHLGLGYIYLAEAYYSLAKSEFEAALGSRKNHPQALLGRGVAQYEEAVGGSDPLRRHELLKNALSDFDAVLKLDPGCIEARYDKIQALFESGLYDEVLREIDGYLSRDSRSIWADGLRQLKIKIEATRAGYLEQIINNAARKRDELGLMDLSRQVPSVIPGQIWSALRQSLDGQPGDNRNPGAEDLVWAAKTMEAGYRAATGDHSLSNMIQFYAGLSPPEREVKRSLEKEFQDIIRVHQAGQLDLALRRSKILESQFLIIRDFWELINLHHLRGNCLSMSRADFRGAASEYREMYRISELLRAPFYRARSLNLLSLNLRDQRKFDESRSLANRAEEIAVQYKLSRARINAHYVLGNRLELLGQFEPALQEYSAALKIAYPEVDCLKVLDLLDNAGAVMDRIGREKEAGALYRLALQQEERFLRDRVLQEIPEVILLRLNLFFKQGELALRSGDLSGAESMFRKSLESASPGMIELQARNRIGLAEVFLRSRRAADADRILAPAMNLVEAGPYPEIAWQANFEKGKILEQSGQKQPALLRFKESIRALEEMRQFVGPNEFRHSFLIDRYEPFKAAVSLLSESGDKQELLKFLDKAKSRTMRETLQLPESGVEAAERPAAGKANAFTTVEYFFMQGSLLILAKSGEGIETFTRKISADAIDREVKEFLECIRVNDASRFLRLGRQLYSQLIAPVEKSLFAKAGGTLVILPDGPLYLLPFAGLQDAAGRFLVEKTPVAYAPSRSIFHHCLMPKRELSGEGGRLLLIDGSQGLPNAQDEIAYLSNLFGRNAEILSAKNVPIPAAAVGNSKILHFSGHATLVQGQPVLMLQRIPKEVVLDCPMIRSWKMPQCRLVNLAGCSTGIGPVAEGESPWGLIPAFLDAGASSIIASLMDVDDASTRIISRRFYDQLQGGAGIAKALQSAQLAVLNSVRSGSNFQPQSWIPYVVVGNPR